MNFMDEVKTHFVNIDWVSGGFHISLGYSGVAVILGVIVMYAMIKRSLRRGN